MKFLNKLQQFMYGRYGLDDLGNFLFKVYILLLIINLFVKSFILTIIELVLVVFVLYRFISKDIYKRSRENILFRNIKKKIFKPFSNIKRNIKDKDHVYKKCHHCKTTLKLPLPNKRGIKKVKCTNCKKRNKFLIFKKAKVELIRNKKKK
jgi:LSD1 subclass zinc finger protein